MVATMLEGGGGVKALVAGPLKKDRYFCAASLSLGWPILPKKPKAGYYQDGCN